MAQRSPPFAIVLEPVAHQWLTLRRIAEIYAVEADIRGISPGQRLSARQTRSAQLVAAFGDWLQAERRKISAKSRLGEKLRYIHNHRH